MISILMIVVAKAGRNIYSNQIVKRSTYNTWKTKRFSNNCSVIFFFYRFSGITNVNRITLYSTAVKQFFKHGCLRLKTSVLMSLSPSISRVTCSKIKSFLFTLIYRHIVIKNLFTRNVFNLRKLKNER